MQTVADSMFVFDELAYSGDTSGMRPAIAYIDLDHLKHNYRLLCGLAGEAEVMAVVKADAYGHGLGLVAPALFEEGCRHFAVTDAEEGALLRGILPGDCKVVLLSGLFDEEDARLAVEHRLTPAISHEAQIRWLSALRFTGQVWLKIDTGMQRLGAEDPLALYTLCRQSGIGVAGIMSHLACADTPGHPLNRLQASAFDAIRQQLNPSLAASLLNSAGMVTMPAARFDVVRPGIALYGSEPVAGQPIGLKPVMQLTGAVIQVRDVPKGTSLSYGASFTAQHNMRIATISLGYGDGLPRYLSNKGQAAVGDRHLPIVGRVCMDYCLLDCSETPLTPGDQAIFWGDPLPADNVAEQLDTIAYTLFTGVAPRVKRMPAVGGR